MARVTRQQSPQTVEGCCEVGLVGHAGPCELPVSDAPLFDGPLAVGVIGKNVVIDFGTHEAAMEGIDRLMIRFSPKVAAIPAPEEAGNG